MEWANDEAWVCAIDSGDGTVDKDATIARGGDVCGCDCNGDGCDDGRGKDDTVNREEDAACEDAVDTITISARTRDNSSRNRFSRS